MNIDIFRAYDIRGIYDIDITPEIIELIGFGVGTYMIDNVMGQEIVLGNDIRFSSDKFSQHFIKGITQTSINIKNCGTTSFGITLFTAWKLHMFSGYITASHNPPEWNGIKFFDSNQIGLLESENKKIGNICINKQYKLSKSLGKVENVNLKDEYIEYLTKKFSINKKLSLVLDCGNGATSLVLPKLFEKCCRVVPIFSNPDGNFPGRGPDITNLQCLQKKVLELNADIGIAFDGDGDRVAIIDNLGNKLTAEEIGILASMYLPQKGTIITNIECGMAFEEKFVPLGFKIIRIPVGHTFMMQNVAKYKAKLGVEASNHFVIPEYFPFDDGVVMALRICEIMSKENKTLSQLIAQIPKYPKKSQSFKCSDKTKFSLVDSLKNEFEKYGKVTDIDGIRVDMDDCWVLVRASNTAPLIRLTVEAKTEYLLNTTIKKFSELLDAKCKMY